MELNIYIGNEQIMGFNIVMNPLFCRCYLEMNEPLEMNAKNELEMNQGLEMNEQLEMNNDLEMNRGNEPQKGDDTANQKNVEMNPTFKLVNYRNNINGGETITKIDIDKVKKEVQIALSGHMIGLKIVTTETAYTVIKSIKRDMKIYDIGRFVVYPNFIKINLNNTTATPCAYYFLDKEVFNEVMDWLKKTDIPITIV